MLEESFIGSPPVSHHCDYGSIPAPCSYLMKVPWSVRLKFHEKSVVQFDSIKHSKFSHWTNEEWGLTGPLGGTA